MNFSQIIVHYGFSNSQCKNIKYDTYYFSKIKKGTPKMSQKFYKSFIKVTVFLTVLFLSIPAFAATILSEKTTENEYTIVLDGEQNIATALQLAIDKSAPALNKAGQKHKSEYDIHIRIQNTKCPAHSNKFPECNWTYEYDIKRDAFNTIIPYTSCDWYNTTYRADRTKCEDNLFDQTITYHLLYMLSAEEEKATYNEIKKIVAGFKGSEYEKIKQIYTYILNNIDYDYSDSSVSITQSGIMTFHRKMGICTGKADLMAEMCHMAGIECHEIGGKAKDGSEAHSWNIVKCNGKWYFCDPTMDNAYDMNYFLRGEDWWQKERAETYGYQKSEYSQYYGEYSQRRMSQITVSKSDYPCQRKQTNTSGNINENTNQNNQNLSQKAQQNMTVKIKTNKIKAIKLKKKKITIKSSKTFTIQNAVGNLTFVKLSGSNKLKISKNGNITVKKNTKRGTYQAKLKIIASGNDKYERAEEFVKVKVVIK